MAYRKPFTPLQRREAVRAYKSYRKQEHRRRRRLQDRAQLRRQYPPVMEAHHGVLDAYDAAINEMKMELTKPDRRVDVDALTRADAAARWFALDYWKLHYPQR